MLRRLPRMVVFWAAPFWRATTSTIICDYLRQHALLERPKGKYRQAITLRKPWSILKGMAASRHRLAFYLGITAGVFLILRALYLPGPLDSLAFPPNTKAGGAYLSQVRHWDDQIRRLEAQSPNEVALYRNAPDGADRIFRAFYESSFRNYNAAMLLLTLSFGAGIGILGVTVYRWRRVQVRQSVRPTSALKDALVIGVGAASILLVSAYVIHSQFDDAAPVRPAAEPVAVSVPLPSEVPSGSVPIHLTCATPGADVDAGQNFIAKLRARISDNPAFTVTDPADDKLECSVHIADGRARITAQWVRDGTHLWAKSYDRPASSADAVVADIVQQMARTSGSL